MVSKYDSITPPIPTSASVHIKLQGSLPRRLPTATFPDLLHAPCRRLHHHICLFKSSCFLNRHTQSNIHSTINSFETNFVASSPYLINGHCNQLQDLHGW